MIFHYFEDIDNNVSGDVLWGISKVYNTIIGSVGIEVFAFLSGISLYFAMTKQSNIRYFYCKRVKRILPAYFIIAILYWVFVI